MKKFIAAFDGLRMVESTISYAIHLAKQAEAHLVGVFLEDFMRRSYGMADIAEYAGVEVDRQMQKLDEQDEAERNDSIESFRSACKEAGIAYSVHRNRNVAMQELLHESIYADLLIIAAAETLTRFEEPRPTRFIKELLTDVQCPVFLVPAQYKPVEKVILLYDGSPSSVFAVKSFSYLFTNRKQLPVEVLTIRKKEESIGLPDGRLMKEFMERHYPGADGIVLKGEAENEIIHYLMREKKRAVVVAGAYRRSKLSRLFKPSMADRIMQEVQLPLFVAHNKS